MVEIINKIQNTHLTSTESPNLNSLNGFWVHLTMIQYNYCPFRWLVLIQRTPKRIFRRIKNSTFRTGFDFEGQKNGCCRVLLPLSLPLSKSVVMTGYRKTMYGTDVSRSPLVRSGKKSQEKRSPRTLLSIWCES